ncbi:hypothetical protein F5876DRAFT_71046 [Lentinula aff. lateritia]|uniref:Uncharacterized protein n=1 Tax=Lentinula aff. lateritia TaxID=2804960 RepID=A0ACC1THA2_9AGAR|nr:hypothetical protein F5876DRAFT_71046 [Lentinula aff. lateritia]
MIEGSVWHEAAAQENGRNCYKISPSWQQAKIHTEEKSPFMAVARTTGEETGHQYAPGETGLRSSEMTFIRTLQQCPGLISEAKFSVSSPAAEDIVPKYCFQLQKTRRPPSSWMSLLQINDSRSVGVNDDNLDIARQYGGIKKNMGLEVTKQKLNQDIDRTRYTHAAGKLKLQLDISKDKKDNRFHDGLGDLFDFAFLEAAVCNKLRYRVDEAEEDRGQSKDDEDRLEDEDEDLRAGTKNQHGISYANSEEEIGRMITAGSQTRTRLKCLNSASPLLPLLRDMSVYPFLSLGPSRRDIPSADHAFAVEINQFWERESNMESELPLQAHLARGFVLKSRKDETLKDNGLEEFEKSNHDIWFACV